MSSNIIPVEVEKHMDILYLTDLIDEVSNVIKEGYGEVNFRILVKGGKITMVSVSKTTTHMVNEAVDSLNKTE